MHRKRCPSDIQTEEDSVMSKHTLHKKFLKRNSHSSDPSPVPLTYITDTAVSQEQRPGQFPPLGRRRPLLSTSIIDHKKNSKESKRKLSTEHDVSSVVTISDDEDKPGNPDKQDSTEKRKDTSWRYNKLQKDLWPGDRHLARQRSPYSASSNPSLNNDISIIEDTKADITSIPYKWRSQHKDTRSLQTSTPPTCSSSAFFLHNETSKNLAPPSTSVEHSISPAINLADGISRSDDDDAFQSRFDCSSPPLKEYHSNTPFFEDHGRSSSPLQHPPVPKREPLDITSFPPSPHSTNSSVNLAIIYDILDTEFDNDVQQSNKSHGMIDKKVDTVDTNTTMNNNNILDVNIKKDRDVAFDNNSGIDDSIWNARISNHKLHINTKKDTSNGIDLHNDMELQNGCELEIVNKPSTSTCVDRPTSSPPLNKSENDDSLRSPTLFIPKPRTRERAKLVDPLYADNSSDNNDPFDLDYSPSRPLSLRSSRRNKGKRIPSVAVEVSDDEMDEQRHVVLFTYPVDRSKGSITITEGDRLRLQPYNYLNDSIIDFYLKWLMDSYSDVNEHNPASVRRRQTAENTHIFSTLFYNRLTQGSEKPIAYENVRKWTSDIDLFSKKYVIFPINENWHWYLVLVYNVDRCVSSSANSYNLETVDDDDDVDRPLIFILDSLGGRQRKCVRVLTKYLSMEAERRRDIDPSQFNAPRFKSANVPKQNNTCDCGVFLLHFVEQFINRPQEFVDTLLVKDSQHAIWKENEIEQKRSELENLFTKVQHQYNIANNNSSVRDE